jgi:hypothetical protein
LARFQKIPITSAGKKLAAAKENAADTRNKMSAGFCAATEAASTATTSSSILATVSRVLVDACGLITL